MPHLLYAVEGAVVTMALRIVPCTLREAGLYIRLLHRHRGPSRGARFCIAAAEGNAIVGVAMCGRPVARALSPRYVLEVTRCCTDGTKNACSKLYGACARIAKELGYLKIITYVLDSEAGTSLRAAGWEEVSYARGRSWDCPSRPRTDKYLFEDKARYEKVLSDGSPEPLVMSPAFEAALRRIDGQLQLFPAAEAS